VRARRRLAVVLVAAAAWTLPALAAPRSARGDAPPAPAAAPVPPAKPPLPPKYDVLRFREDHSPLLCTPPCRRCDGSDRAKALALPGPAGAHVNVGGQARLRLEAWSDQGFGGVPGDDLWSLLRLRAHADVHAGPNLRLFAEGIWADAEGREGGPRPVDENRGDVLNLFAEGSLAVPGGRLGAWAGRRELLFGRQRVVGPGDWTNVCRAFEGLGAWWTGRGARVDAFWARPVLVDPDDPDERDDDASLAGAYAHRDLSGGRVVEAYALRLERDEATWLGVTGRERRLALGAASWGPIGRTRFDHEVEVAWQTGEFDGERICAGAALAEVGWKPRVPCGEPRVAVGVDWASGDDGGPGDGLGTYHQLFPTGHAFLGWADLVGRQNVVAARLTVTAKPAPRLALRVDLHRFWRASEDDAAYAASGAVLRAPAGSRARAVATELDLQARFTVDRHLEVEAGHARVFADDFVRDTGPSEDVAFTYVQLTFTF
jgi:hypothetical protein